MFGTVRASICQIELICPPIFRYFDLGKSERANPDIRSFAQGK